MPPMVGLRSGGMFAQAKRSHSSGRLYGWLGVGQSSRTRSIDAQTRSAKHDHVADMALSTICVRPPLDEIGHQDLAKAALDERAAMSSAPEMLTCCATHGRLRRNSSKSSGIDRRYQPQSKPGIADMVF